MLDAVTAGQAEQIARIGRLNPDCLLYLLRGPERDSVVVEIVSPGEVEGPRVPVGAE